MHDFYLSQIISTLWYIFRHWWWNDFVQIFEYKNQKKTMSMFPIKIKMLAFVKVQILLSAKMTL